MALRFLADALRPHWQRSGYRLRQFWQGLQAQVSPEERQLLNTLLPPAAAVLFAEMPIDAQRHGLNVLYAVRQAGFDQPELAVAALLHDAGKNAAAQAGLALGLWLRGPLVLIETLWPALLRYWRSPDPQQGWRYLIYVQQEHPRIGAQWAQQLGCAPLTCWLIEHHQEQVVTAADPHQLVLLQILQIADGSN